MLDVRRWAKIGQMHEVEGLSIHEIARRTGHDHDTVRRALRREGPPVYRRPPRPSKLDPHHDEIKALLWADPRIPSMVIRERVTESGYRGSKTILDDYVRCARCFSRRGPISARSIGRARPASSTSGSPRTRSRPAMARLVAASSSLPVWASRARAPARSSSRRSCPRSQGA